MSRSRRFIVRDPRDSSVARRRDKRQRAREARKEIGEAILDSETVERPAVSLCSDGWGCQCRDCMEIWCDWMNHEDGIPCTWCTEPEPDMTPPQFELNPQQIAHAKLLAGELKEVL